MHKILTRGSLGAALLSLALFGVACTGSGLETISSGDNNDTANAGSQDGNAQSGGAVSDAGGTADGSGATERAKPDATTPEPDAGSTPLSDASTNPESDGGAVSEDTSAECPGCFGSPCEDNLDCISGWCTQGADGLQCTKECSADCPAGFSCQQVTLSSGDPVFLCLYDHVHYCRPCALKADCSPPLSEVSQAMCAELWPGMGSYCVTPCNVDSDCPAGAQCSPLEGADADFMGCQPVSDMCTCSDLAVASAASTECALTNEFGSCSGERMCSEEGLTECDAMTPMPEVCNGSDDDCDGTIDEAMVDVDVPCDGEGDEDLCEDGVTVCEDGTLVCVDEPGTGETCNDIDDDCDGTIDEAIAGSGEACDGSDADACTDGVTACVGGTIICVDDEASTEETCNGEDDDCDGEIDEGFDGLGTPCDGPDADLCNEGVWECAEGELVCNDMSDDNVEVCDNGDDDCDGEVDEAFPLKGSACDGEDGDFCSEGTWVCDGEVLVCDDDPGTAPELCNNADDDCDGTIDEDVAESGAACDGADPDECADGTFLCVEGELTCDDADSEEHSETCNGEDDDCDGEVDENFATLGEPCDGPDSDLCNEGVWACQEGLMVCNDTSDDTVEVCDNGDDDCDGEIDETFALKGSACDGDDGDFCSEGTWICDGTALVCSDDPATAPEFCNDMDDDCDGQIDEGYDTKFEPCDGDDADECQDGFFVCAPSGVSVECNDDEAQGEELCNESDDDCDGKIDESFLLKATPCDGDDEDACSDGMWACDGIGLVCQDTPESILEVCGGGDEDCDSQVDEGFEAIGTPCDGSDADACTDGTWTCDGGSLTCDDDAGSVDELCNTLDDDCDGQTDEAFPLLGTACDGEDDDLCTDGQWICDGTAPVCDDDGASTPEVCNGLDDDCDGQTDEGLVASACMNANEAGECTGTESCVDGQLVCDASEPAAELCNNVDDNCDGEVDNGIFPEECTRSNGFGTCAGMATCDGAGQMVCDAAVPEGEMCNNADEDCDGSIDEDVPTAGCEATNEHGTCVGSATCDGQGQMVCDAPEPLAELCNELDDNCDGTTDEGFEDKGEPCDGDDEDLCKDGVFVCGEDGDYACTDDAASHVELCNGEDDDCDGVADEDFPTLGAPCDGDDEDLCADGVVVCSDAGQTACTDDASSEVEECNGVDDNCDGVTDEGCCGALGQICCDTGEVCQGDFSCVDGTCICEPQASSGCIDGDAWWLDCQGEPSELKSACGSCGCIGGTCNTVDPPICVPDEEAFETQEVPCGLCGSQTQIRTRTCTLGCDWPEWGPWVDDGLCDDQGVCSPEATEEGSQNVPCGDCGQQAQSRQRTCGDSCQWGDWSDWEDEGICLEGGVCAPEDAQQETRVVDCGFCGSKEQTRSRTCTAQCGWSQWGDWQDSSACSNPGECQPGNTDSQTGSDSCGNCGSVAQQRDRVCTASCQWGDYGGWYNTGECASEGECSPNSSDSLTQEVSCGFGCGVQLQQRDRTCTNSCSWGDYSPWQNVGGCSGGGECSPGAGDSEGRNIPCGNCGSQYQERYRTCTAGCGWGAWGDWQNVGGCSGSGVCSPNQTDNQSQTVGCGNCGQQLQTRSRTCTNSCSWGSFSSWQNSGGCGVQGVCSPNTPNTETQTVGCGNCGTKTQSRTQTCTNSCSWGSFGPWTDTSSCGGQGTCSPNAVDVESQMLPCGNCGFQAQTRSRTCNGSCGWGAFSGWQNVGGCSESGVCSPNDSETQTQACSTECGSGTQSRSRTCTASCGWGSYGPWSGCTAPKPLCELNDVIDNPSCPDWYDLDFLFCQDPCVGYTEYCENLDIFF